jgi:hypothetical protein
MKIMKPGIALVAAFMLLIVLSACGDNGANEPEPDINQEQGNDETPNPDDNRPEEDPTNEAPPANGEDSDGAAGEPKEGTGRYVGQIDQHSIEIETSDGPVAFRINAAIADKLDELQPNDPVEFEYYEQTVDAGEEAVTQLILTELVKTVPAELPETRNLELEIEGMKESRPAKLAEGDGYRLYVLENYEFTMEEPGRDVLMFTHDDRYFVRMEKLDPNSPGKDEWEANAEAELKEIGEVQRLSGEEIPHTMRDAEFFMRASNREMTKEIIVKRYSGVPFRLTLFIPSGEAEEGFVPSAYAMLNTIVAP